VLVRAAMSRVRIETLLLAVLGACGGATEDGASTSDGGTSPSNASSSATPRPVPTCDTSSRQKSRTYDLATVCAAADAGLDGCETFSCEQLCEWASYRDYEVGGGTPSGLCVRGDGGLKCDFYWPCGRRFEGMKEPATNDVLRNAAYLEAASVIAFEHLARDLAFHEAPFHLVRAALRAADDERRHTEMVHALAVGPRPEPNATPWRARSLVDIAIENAVEGCVGEAWGALVALAQARDARSADVRTAFAAIASDEIDHAALAHEIHAWIGPLLTAEERRAVDRAKAAAWERFEIDIDPAVATELGIPNGHASRRMIQALASRA
jgi:hypothetical protein